MGLLPRFVEEQPDKHAVVSFASQVIGVKLTLCLR